MAHEIVMPQLSLSMDQGQIVNWRKKTGDRIEVGDVMLEVESDKATVEVESVERGVLQIVLGPDDGEVAVGTVIAYMLAEGEAAVAMPARGQTAGSDGQRSRPAVGAEPPEQESKAAVVPPPLDRPPSSPAARRRAAELHIDWRQVQGTGRGGRIKERDVLRFSLQPAEADGYAPAPTLDLQLTPLARRVADDFGLDETLLASHLPGKARIEREDVEEVIRQIVRERRASGPLAAPDAPNSVMRPPRREPIGAVRKRIAERMLLSTQTNAPVTLTTEIDAGELLRLRESLKSEADGPTAPGYNVLIMKAAARALMDHPLLNASIEGSEIVYWPSMNIGLAVDTPRGLVVPVLRDVAAKTVGQLAAELAGLIEKAVKGEATAEDLGGGTFTVTNLGVQGIDAFTPIINPPQCAVLGVGRLCQKIVAVDGQPAVRTMMVLSLTFDHRLVDGAPAARFLQRVGQLLEKPYRWML